MSVLIPITDATVLKLLPRSGLLNFAGQTLPTGSILGSSSANMMLETRFTGFSTGVTPYNNYPCLPSSIIFAGVRLLIIELTLVSNKTSSAAVASVTTCDRNPLSPDNSAAESSPRNCAIDSSPISTKVCNSPQLKDRNFSVQYSPTLISSSLPFDCSSTPIVHLLTVCSSVHAHFEKVKVFLGDVPVSGTSTLSGHTLRQTRCSSTSPSVHSSSYIWALLSKLRKLTKVRGILTANLVISHRSPIQETRGYS